VLDRPGLATPAEVDAWGALRERVSINLHPVGSPVALGMAGLAAATLVVSGLQLGWVEAAEGRYVALALIGFGFGAQIVASTLAFLARDGLAGTALGVLALTWLVVGLVLHASEPGATSGALGLFLLVSGVAMTLFAAVVALSKLVLAAVFATAALRLALTGVYELSGDRAWEDAAGVTGVVLCALALYAATAVSLEDAAGRTVLPLGRRGKGSDAMHGTLLEQVRDTPTEPGVRKQL
jgi:succinate-acetate transporter protein